MKNIPSFIFCALLFLVSFSLAAQDNTPPEDLSKSGSRDRLILELNYNGWAGAPDSLDVKWYNRGVNFYFMYDFKLGKQDYVSFAPGIGLSLHNVYFRSEITQVTDSLGATSMQFLPFNEDRDVRTNKLSSNFIEMPLELRFRSKPTRDGNRFKANLGLRVAYLFNAHTKFKGDAADDFGTTIKNKTFLIPSINKFRIGPSVRLGYGNFSIVGYLSLTDLFADDQGPGIRPFSVGISFNSF